MSTTSPVTKAGAATGNWLDERLGASKVVKEFSRKVFPDHWSFMLGEIALYSFIILLLSGTFLTFFFIPSSSEVVYNGPYTTLAGQHVSEAFDSTMRISFEVRGGLLMRQIHHWAALIFVVSIIVHMFRIFFTGAFRKPREINWVIGMILALTAVIEASSVTRCRTTCSPVTACGSPRASSCRPGGRLVRQLLPVRRRVPG